jgi:hypothetical protein
MKRVLDSHWLWAVIIDCNCKGSASKSNQPIENPSLLVTQTPHTWQYVVKMYVCMLSRCCRKLYNSSIPWGQIRNVSSEYLYQQDGFLGTEFSACCSNPPWNNWPLSLPVGTPPLRRPPGYRIFQWRENMWTLKSVWIDEIFWLRNFVPTTVRSLWVVLRNWSRSYTFYACSV